MVAAARRRWPVILLAWVLALGVFGRSGPAAAPARAGEKAPGAAQVEALLDLARKTLAFVEQSAPRPDLAAELKDLERRLAAPAALGDAERKALYARLRALRRRTILSHPILDFDRLLINKRPADIPGHMCDQYLGRHSKPGPGLAILESWKESPKETLLLAGKLPPGMVLNPDLSFDARRVLFSFCDHSASSNRELLGYHVYEAAIDGAWVRQITGTAADPMAGALARQTVLIEDLDPCYLPGGGFAFISTRSQQYGRCHGSRYVPAYVLYRAEADGSGIRQISFNEANEWDPSVLADGRIVYTRWDYINRHDTNFQSLWVTRPDGTATAHFYGNYSVGPCMIAEAQAVPGSPKVVATATDHHGFTAGSIILVDPLRGEDGGEPLLAVTPEIPFPERAAPPGTASAAAPIPEDAPRRAPPRGGMRCATPWPLSEDLFLAAYPHEGQYAIYLVDTLGGRELIYYDPDVSCFSPTPVRPRPVPPVLSSAVAGKEAEPTGRFVVEDVYRSTQPLPRGSIKALRVSEIISQPTRAKPALSYVNNEIIKRIVGTAAVGEDGSVAFEAPAAAPLQFQLLDAHGMAVMTMRSLVYLQPGETASCVGCHEPRETTPPPAAGSRPIAVQKLRPPAGPRYDGGFSFVRTVQPVLDRYCIGCHGLGKTEAGVNLLGMAQPAGQPARRPFTASYESLLRRPGMVVIAQRNQETATSRPKDYFAHAGRLAAMLLDGHKDGEGRPRVRLGREDFRRIADWLDLNAQFYGDYSFNRAEARAPSPEGEKALREAIEKRFGADLARQAYEALVNVAMPAESRILQAPLALEAGGWGQVAGGWPSSADPAYREMLGLVEASLAPLPFHDVAGTCGRDACVCGCCWVRLGGLVGPKEGPSARSGP